MLPDPFHAPRRTLSSSLPSMPMIASRSFAQPVCAGLAAALLAAVLGGCALPGPGVPVAAPAGAGSRAPEAAAGMAARSATPAPAGVASAQVPQASASAPTRAGQAPAQAALSPAGVNGGSLGIEAVDRMLREVAEMAAPAASARVQALQSLGARRSAQQRLELAYMLLMRTTPGSDDVAQARELLKGLERQAGDPACRQFVRLLDRLGRQAAELSQSRADLAKATRKAAELEDKIGQIKNLEVQLQNRSQSRGGSKR